jgi:hypothetical protein
MSAVFPVISIFIPTILISLAFVFRRIEGRRWAKILVREFPELDESLTMDERMEHHLKQKKTEELISSEK